MFEDKKNELKVSSIKSLKKFNQGELVRIPSFVEGEDVIFKLGRVNLLGLAKQGKIPNSLKVIAEEMFTGTTKNSSVKGSKVQQDKLKDMAEIMDLVCENSILEPTYKELLENEIELTDEQKMFIFNYSQRGIKEIAPSINK